MIVLDTNVLSELLRATPDQRVLDWIDRQPVSHIYTTVISRAEMTLGILAMVESSKKNKLTQAAQFLLETNLAGRQLPFDEAAADEFAKLSVDLKRVGRPMGTFDGMIAAIVRSRGARLVTRNAKDFMHSGCELIDPWEG